MKPILTIFTPTYNRAYVLHKLYESLCCQTDKNFEWLVIDDGSSDNTETLINKWINENKLNLRYVKQVNGGKHRAINRGIEEATGELFFIVDSDDYLTKDAVAWILSEYPKIRNNKEFAGIVGTRVYPNGKRIGGTLNFQTIDCNTLDFRMKYNIKGDMAEVVKTNVMRKFIFPEINNEFFCPEAMVWDKIAKDHIFRFYNYPIYICAYLPDGLTAKITKLRHESPLTSMLYYSNLYHLKIPYSQKIKASINFWRFANSFSPQKYDMVNILLPVSFILGKLLKYNDNRK